MLPEKECPIQDYFKTMSSESMLGFLYVSMMRNEWRNYTHALPQIFATLQSRGVPVSEQIQAAWEAFATDAEASAEESPPD